MAGCFAVCALAAVALLLHRLLLRYGAESSEEEHAISVNNLDIGEVWAEDAFKWSVDFVNHTDHSIEVLALRRSCDCFQADPSTFAISPHGKRSVAMTINLANTDPTQSVHEPRGLSLSFVPVIRGQDAGQRAFVIRGRIKNPCAFSVRGVLFDERDYQAREHRYVDREVFFESAVELRRVAAHVEPPYVSVRAELKSKTRGALHLVPNADLTVDRFDCRLDLVLESVNGKLFHVSTLPICGDVIRDVQIVPDTVSFRPAHLGDTLETTVLLRSRCDDHVTVLSVEPSSEDTLVRSVPCEISNASAYRVCHHITRIGAHTVTVDFNVALRTGEPQRFRFQLSLVGLP